MPQTHDLENWCSILAIGSGNAWGAPSRYSTDGKTWGTAMKTSSSVSTPPLSQQGDP
ncbi:hypothetical protein GMOD_00000503 [Pyrenophora seminiperda CCB06]|uniref:Uncharacterized protein n=1 Tax=Pyrenophora seminiperda CCB06 TaxID=1302712 RepID=A0A3M7M7P7_9PLEO|nr:hypothetical protein GMOD_00000503 [Pyrenophora seminiperda CCB06]